MKVFKRLIERWRAHKALVRRKKDIAEIFETKFGGVHFVTDEDFERAGGFFEHHWDFMGHNFSYHAKFSYNSVRSLHAEIHHFGLYKVAMQLVCQKMGRMAHYYGFREVWFSFRNSGRTVAYQYKDGVIQEIDLTPD